MYTELQPDPNRLKIMEEPVTDYRAFYAAESAWRKAAMLVKHQFRPFYFVVPPLWRVNLRKWKLHERVAPDFCSTGAVRSGTSTLSNYIFQHPCVVLPLAKELSASRLKLTHLQAQFPKQRDLQRVKEKYGVAKTGHSSPFLPSATVTYFNKKLNPNLKTVVTLRNPVERVISHWRWDLMKTRNLRKDALWKTMPGFESALRQEMASVAEGGCGFQLYSGSGSTSYLRHSIYLPFLKLLIQEMGRENVCIINADDFFLDPNYHIAKVYEFLNLPPYTPETVTEVNPSPKITVSDEIRQELQDFFLPFNESLYEYLGQDFCW